MSTSCFLVIFHTGKHNVFTGCPGREGTPVTKDADVLNTYYEK